MGNVKPGDVIVTGFALFAMFFGAGNVIFPPYLGSICGTEWPLAIVGFSITGIGLSLLGVIVMSMYDGSFERFASRGGKAFSVILGVLVVLCIGPLLAIPRTAATTYELAIKPFFPNMNSYLPIVGFFLVVFYFSLKRSSVIDIIGRILTPVLLFLLLFIIVSGIINPISTPVSLDVVENTFATCFNEGYQTMDALAAVIFAGIIVQSIKARGYSKSSSVKITILSGLMAAVGLLVVYGGLMYLGATVSYMSQDIPRTVLLVTLVSKIAGQTGIAMLGFVVAIACLTTAVGLTAATGDFFSRLSKGRVSYFQVITASTIFSAFFAGIGVEGIIRFAVPVLVVVYPVVIVLLFMNILSPVLKDSCRYVYVYALTGTLLVSLYDGIAAMGVSFPVIENVLSQIPLAGGSFGWLLAASLGFGAGLIRDRFCVSLESYENCA